MSIRGDDLELIAAVLLLFGYTVAGVLLAGGRQMLASAVAIVAGIVALLIEIVEILRR